MTLKKQWESNVLAGAATVHNGLFLLLKRSKRESFLPDTWGIPAGQVRRREDPSDACLRELLEETGLQGTVVDLVGYSTFASTRNGIELSNLQLNFLVRAEDRTVKLDPASHSDSRWIALDDTSNDLLDPFTREIMFAACDHYKEIEARLRGAAYR
jgi:8-oxo-dGTP diphosphatase